MSPGLMGQRSALHYSCTPSSSARLPPSIPASVPLCDRSYEGVLARRLVRRGEQKRPLTSQPTMMMNETPLTFSQGTRCKLKIGGKINPNIPKPRAHARSPLENQTPGMVCGEKRRGFWFSKEKLHQCRLRAKTGGKNITEERQTQKAHSLIHEFTIRRERTAAVLMERAKKRRLFPVL